MRPEAAAFAVDMTPLTINANTSGTIVIFRASSHRPPIASAASIARGSTGHAAASQIAPSASPAASPASIRQASFIVPPLRPDPSGSMHRLPRARIAGRPGVDPMQTFALVIAVVSTVAYHLVTKLVPAGTHPIASLMTAYVCGSLACAAILVMTPGEGGFRGHFSGVNWTAPALAATVVLLDFGFILLY